jgi:hypothetical protein
MRKTLDSQQSVYVSIGCHLELTQRPDDEPFDKLILRGEPQQKEGKRYLN